MYDMYNYDMDAEAVGLHEAIENAVDYYQEKGLSDQAVLDILSNYRQSFKDKRTDDEIVHSVDRWLGELFGDGRGCE